MITELQWKYAEIERLHEDQRHIYDLPWYSDEFVSVEAAFSDMEFRAAEQAWYDRHECPPDTMPNYDHHHNEAEPVPQYQLDTDKITELLNKD